MKNDSLWARITRARMFQVLAVYLAASWGILQVAELLQDSLALPDWVLPVAMLLLLIGLLVIMATAWVQSLPTTAAKAEAGEIPGAWEVGPRALGEAIKEGRLPHLTWGRSILGGVFAFWFLFGLAGLYVVIKDRGESFAPTEAIADMAGEGIAIVPFTVRGDGEDVWREGMVDLFATSLDDVGGYRTIDSRTVMARWNEAVGEGETPDMATTLAVAERAGANYVMTGSAVAIGDNVRLAAEIIEVSSGNEVGSGQVEGPAEEVLSLVDELSIKVMGALLREGGSEILTAHQAASLTTSSLPALKAYLQAEALYRRASFTEAIELYEQALASDSNFVLAHYRIAEAYGWSEDIDSERAEEHYQSVERLIDGLRARDRAIVEGNAALIRGDLTAIDDVRATANKYPDDPEAWFLLTEFYVHNSAPYMVTHEEKERVLQKAIDLDPNFAPYWIHYIELAIQGADSAEAIRRYDEYQSLSPRGFKAEIELAMDMFLGDSATQAAAFAGLDTIPDMTLMRTFGEFAWQTERPYVMLRVGEEAAQRGLPGAENAVRLHELATGQFERMWETHNDPDVSAGWAAWAAYTADRFGGEIDPEVLAGFMTVDYCGEPGQLNFFCVLYVGSYHVDRGDLDAATETVEWFRNTVNAVAEADTSRAGYAEAGGRFADALAAYASSLEDGPEAAMDRLETMRVTYQGPGTWYRLWLANLAEEAGELRQAIKYYDGLKVSFLRPYANYRLAHIYTELRDEDQAAAHWKALLQNWEEADEGLAWESEAREALEVLLDG